MLSSNWVDNRLSWPTEDIETMLAAVLEESSVQQYKQAEQPARAEQYSLFAAEE